jgi:hypothetical protein
MKPPRSAKIRTLDVRPLIARGEEPFTKIMAAVAALSPQDSLVLLTPFLPAPLIEKLRSEGFEAQPERADDGSWRTRFVRE